MRDKSSNDDVPVSKRTSFGQVQLALYAKLIQEGIFSTCSASEGRNGDKDKQSMLLCLV